MTPRRLSALFGILLFIGGIAVVLFMRHAQGQALSLDGGPSPGPVPNRPISCAQSLKTDITLGRRVMAENETQALTVSLTNGTKSDCTVTLLLNAPFFVMNPPTPERTVTIAKGTTIDISWILTPQRLGTFEIAVSIDGANTTLGVTVTNIFGLRAWQVKLLSTLSTFLGSILTLPWWIEQWQKWREQQKTKQRVQAPNWW